jgi:hypothetical protein
MRTCHGLVEEVRVPPWDDASGEQQQRSVEQSERSLVGTRKDEAAVDLIAIACRRAG